MGSGGAVKKFRLLTIDDLFDIGRVAKAIYQSKNPDGPPFSELSEEEQSPWHDRANEKMEALDWWGDQ